MESPDPQSWLLLALVAGLGVLSILAILASTVRNELHLQDTARAAARLRAEYKRRLREHQDSDPGSTIVDPVEEPQQRTPIAA